MNVLSTRKKSNKEFCLTKKGHKYKIYSISKIRLNLTMLENNIVIPAKNLRFISGIWKCLYCRHPYSSSGTIGTEYKKITDNNEPNILNKQFFGDNFYGHQKY